MANEAIGVWSTAPWGRDRRCQDEPSSNRPRRWLKRQIRVTTDQRRMETGPREETRFEEMEAMPTRALKIKLTRAAWLGRHATSCPPTFHHITNATLRVARYDIMSLAASGLWHPAILAKIKKRGCTEADDARGLGGDHTTVPLEILNSSFVQLVPKRKYSRRQRECVLSRGRGRERYIGEHVSSENMADRQRRDHWWWLFMFDLPPGAGERRLGNAGFHLCLAHRRRLL